MESARHGSETEKRPEVDGAQRRRARRPRRIPRHRPEGRSTFACGRCCMCGRSTERHGVVLVAIHEVSREREGNTVSDNLHTVCEGGVAGLGGCWWVFLFGLG